MKVLEQARPNLPQKPAKSTKPAVKGSSKPDDDYDDVEPAKTANAASKRAVNKAGKPNSAAAAGKKVQCFVLSRY